jgi:hypothetical protein
MATLRLRAADRTLCSGSRRQGGEHRDTGEECVGVQALEQHEPLAGEGRRTDDIPTTHPTSGFTEPVAR